MACYPQRRSALIPLCHLAQAQDGWLTEEAMEDIAELVGCTPAEVRGTATFYDMLHTEPVGRHVVTVCTNIACMLAGAYEVLDHAEASLGISVGQTTADGEFTLEEAECLAGCDKAPCVQVNHRFFGPLDPDGFDALDRGPALGPPRRHGARARGLEPGRAQRGPARPGGEIGGPQPARSGPGDGGGARVITQGAPDRHLAGGARGLVHARALPRHRRLRRPPQGAVDGAGGRRRRGQQGEPARAWRGRLPGGPQVVDAAAGRDDLPRRERRRERAGDLQGPHADRARSAPDHRGDRDRGLRDRASSRRSSTAGESSPSASSACSRRATRPTPTARSAPTSSAAATRSTS